MVVLLFPEWVTNWGTSRSKGFHRFAEQAAPRCGEAFGSALAARYRLSRAERHGTSWRKLKRRIRYGQWHRTVGGRTEHAGFC